MARKKSKEFSEKSPFKAGELVVYPTRLQLGDCRCNFDDIEHLSWRWKSTSINLITFHEARLGLSVAGMKRTQEVTSSTIIVRPKLVWAYQYIARNTFRQRLARYLREVEECGGFRYGDGTIYTDGRIVNSREESFRLDEVETRAFELRFSRRGLFKQDFVLNLEKDQDVILSLVDYFVKNPKDPNSVRIEAERRKERTRSTNRILVAVVSIVAKIAAADGHVDECEWNVLRDSVGHAFPEFESSTAHLKELFEGAANDSTPMLQHAHDLVEQAKGNLSLLLAIYAIAFDVAGADGVLSAEEELLLLQLETVFGIPGSSEQRTQQERSRGNPNGRVTPSVADSLVVLGFEELPSASVLKKKYRRLVLQYHPDRVQHLGDEFAVVAEKKITEINLAYDNVMRSIRG